MILRQGKDGLTFKNAKTMALTALKSGAANTAIANIAGNDKIAQMLQEILEKGMENPASLFTPQTIFKFFANSRGTMSFEDFANIFTQLGVTIPHARLLSIFSAADSDKKGELTYLNFKHSFERLQKFFVIEIMNNLGLGVQDLVISFCMAVTMLMLMFVFIFVGIGAFSPTTSFSSVTNSIMPLVAGGSVNKDNKDDKKSPQELKDLAAQASSVK